jgi:cell division protein FtsZ
MSMLQDIDFILISSITQIGKRNFLNDMVKSGIKPKTTVLGIGGAGIKIVKSLVSIKGTEWLNIGVADTDLSAINDSEIHNAFSVGGEWTRGTGCGGDPERGARAFAHPEENEIEEFVTGSSMLIITGGFGGGACTGGAPILARLAKRLKIPAVCILTTPFSFEGQARIDTSEKGLKLLLPDSDVVIPIPNDILFTSLKADIPAKEAFSKADSSVASAILGIAEILRCGNIISTDFADMKEMLKGKKSLCHIGFGLSDDPEVEDRCADAAEKLLESPLLGGKGKLESADAMIITVIGGDDLEIGEMKQALEIVRHSSGDHTRIITGVNTDPAYTGKVFTTVIAIEYDQETPPVPDHSFSSPAPTPQRAQRIVRQVEEKESKGELFQGELAFQTTSRGHFTKTTPNIVKGEDLDIPPFQRQGIILDKGA